MSDGTGGEDRPLWQLSRDEQRILLITFAGGLASIVVGAAIIGASLALARYGGLNWFWIVLLALLAGAQTSILVQDDLTSVPKRMVIALAASAFLLWSVLILWLVGILAGIH